MTGSALAILVGTTQMSDATPLLASSWWATIIPEFTNSDQTLSELMDELAEALLEYSQHEEVGFEIRYFVGAANGSVEHPVIGIGVSSSFGEVYFVEDEQGRGWLVCRTLPAQKVSFRSMYDCESADLLKASLDVLTKLPSTYIKYRIPH